MVSSMKNEAKDKIKKRIVKVKKPVVPPGGLPF
jgi:hypothetical protein